MDMEKMMQEMIEKKANEKIKEYLDEYINKFDVQDVAYNIAEKRMWDKFMSDDEKLEPYIIEATKKEMFSWYDNNIGYDDMKWCIKEALTEKIKEFSLEEIVDLFNKTR